MPIVFSIDKKVIARVQVKGIITIGSSNYCDVCIPDSSVDENQCRIILSNGGLYLQNIGLNNRPIVLNKSIVDKEMIVELQEGILKIGDVDVEIAIKKDASDSKKKKLFDTSTWLKWVGIAVGVIILTGLGVIVGKTLSYNNTIETSETIIESSFEETELPTEVEEMVELFNLSNATINSIDNQTYTGTPIYYPLEIVTGDVVLTEGEDYTCTYENNTGVGVATVTITGNDVTTTGSTSVTYAIVTGDAVCDSSEHFSKVNFVERIYASALGRYPESEVLITYVNQLVNQTITGAEIVNVVYNSAEFSNRNLTDSDFLVTVYRGVLNREPDEGGFNSNLSLLNGGMSRYDLMNSIIDASEFESLCDSMGVIVSAEADSGLADGRYVVEIIGGQFNQTHDYSVVTFHVLEEYTFTDEQVYNFQPGDVLDLSDASNCAGQYTIMDDIGMCYDEFNDRLYMVLTYDGPFSVEQYDNSGLWFLSTSDDDMVYRIVDTVTLPVSDNLVIEDYRNTNPQTPEVFHSFEDFYLSDEWGADGVLIVNNNQIESATFYWHP